MNARLLASCAAVSLAAGLAGSAHAGVVFFDGFESPSSPGISYGGTDTAGASFGDGTGIQQNGSPFGYAAAPEGTQTAHIQSDGTFYEDVSGLTSGATYTLSFYDATRSGYAVDPIMVSYEPELGTDPTVIMTTPSSTTFTLASTTFTYEGSGPAMFAISGTNPQTSSDDFNAAVDSFQIASAVPEPSIWAMMLAGVALMGASLRFSRKRGVAALAA